VLLTSACSLTFGPRVSNAEGLAESQICAVGTSLVPALDSSCDGVENDSEVEHAREFEAVGELFAYSQAIGFIEFFDLFECSGRLGEEGAFDKERFGIFKAVLFGEVLDVGDEIGFGDSNERIADLALEVGGQLNYACFALVFIIENGGAVLCSWWCGTVGLPVQI